MEAVVQTRDRGEPRFGKHFNWTLVRTSEGPRGGRHKGGRGRKLSHFSFCYAFRCCVVYSPCFPVWGEEKVMTIYDAGPPCRRPPLRTLEYRGLARVLLSPSNPQNCRKKQRILEKSSFIFCGKPTTIAATTCFFFSPAPCSPVDRLASAGIFAILLNKVLLRMNEHQAC